MFLFWEFQPSTKSTLCIYINMCIYVYIWTYNTYNYYLEISQPSWFLSKNAKTYSLRPQPPAPPGGT